MPAWKYWGRWLAVVPVAIAGAVLVSFPVHWILLATFTRDDSFIQLAPDALANLESLALAFFGPLTLITAGAWAAPRFKFESAVALSAVLLLGLGLVYGYALFAPQSRVTISVPMVVLNLLGVGGALGQAWTTQRRPAGLAAARPAI